MGTGLPELPEGVGQKDYGAAGGLLLGSDLQVVLQDRLDNRNDRIPDYQNIGRWTGPYGLDDLRLDLIQTFQFFWSPDG